MQPWFSWDIQGMRQVKDQVTIDIDVNNIFYQRQWLTTTQM